MLFTRERITNHSQSLCRSRGRGPVQNENRKMKEVPDPQAIFGVSPRASGQVVRQPAHTLGLKRAIAREAAALFTDLPQMDDGSPWGTFS
jgi:hypothetical protein